MWNKLSFLELSALSNVVLSFLHNETLICYYFTEHFPPIFLKDTSIQLFLFHVNVRFWYQDCNGSLGNLQFIASFLPVDEFV